MKVWGVMSTKHPMEIRAFLVIGGHLYASSPATAWQKFMAIGGVGNKSRQQYRRDGYKAMRFEITAKCLEEK